MLTTVRFHKSKGGTEKVMIDTANAMTHLGHNVAIVFYDKNGSTPGFSLDPRVRLFNCKDEHVPIFLNGFFRELRSIHPSKQNRNKSKALLKLKMLSYRFGKTIKNNPADVFITYEPKLSAMLVKEFNIIGKTITTFQFNPAHIANRIDTKYIEPYISKAGPIQILRDEFLIDTQKYFPSCNKIIIIPNAIETHNKQSKLKNNIIVNVGRISDQKNQILLAEAFSLIHKKYPSWQVKIWGENIDKSISNKIKKIIADHNMSSQFSLCGATNNVIDQLEEASIFAFPSIYEGFGLALVEAMSVGLPCIGLKTCPAVNTILENEVNGILVDNSVDAFAGAISRLIENSQLRSDIGEKARLTAKNFSPENIWKQWEKLLLDIQK